MKSFIVKRYAIRVVSSALPWVISYMVCDMYLNTSEQSLHTLMFCGLSYVMGSAIGFLNGFKCFADAILKDDAK